MSCWKWRKQWPNGFGWIFLSAELQLPDWLLQSEAKQASLPLKRKHIWYVFVTYKGTHSSLLHCFGGGIIWNSPLIQYLCLAHQSRQGANEMTKHFKQLLSSEWQQQTDPLPQWPLIMCHSRKRTLRLHLWAAGRAGDEDWCGCLLCQQTAIRLSHAHRLLRAAAHDLLSLSSRGVHIAQGEMSKVRQRRRETEDIL